MKRGQVLILVIVSVAVAMASYTCWHHYRKGYHALRFWGGDTATLIRHARDVQLLSLSQPADLSPAELGKTPTLRIDDEEIRVKQQVDISTARGLVHARHTLIEDQNFIWNNASLPERPRWDFALQFSDQQGQVTLVFDIQNHVVRRLPNGRPQVMTEIIERIDRFLQPLLSENGATQEWPGK